MSNQEMRCQAPLPADMPCPISMRDSLEALLSRAGEGSLSHPPWGGIIVASTGPINPTFLPALPFTAQSFPHVDWEVVGRELFSESQVAAESFGQLLAGYWSTMTNPPPHTHTIQNLCLHLWILVADLDATEGTIQHPIPRISQGT